MQTEAPHNDRLISCLHCITGKQEELSFRGNTLTAIAESAFSGKDTPFIGPGLIDLQVNGINGIDFNNPAVQVQDIVNATQFLLSRGVTTFFPTVITNSKENICKIVDTIYRACLSNEIVNDCIGGIHLEGPFLSTVPGAKGAHDEKYIIPPEWALFQKFQKAAGGKIKLVTIAPELEGAYEFIEKCTQNKILVSIGHSMAGSKEITLAVKSGASLSTHLGNAVPLMLPRHPNMIWDQLAEEDLYTCLVTDGIHIPDSFMKVVIKNKAEKTLLVSDATCFAGMSPGEYQNHIGGTVILDEEKRVSLKSTPGLLAGAAKTLLENIETLLKHNIATLGASWQMASANVATLLSKNDEAFDNKSDWVIFRLKEKEVQVEQVIKKGKVVFQK